METDRAATSVIGVALLVGIVVLLAATVAVYTFAQGNAVDRPAPEASFAVDTCASCPSLADPVAGSTTNFVNVTYTQGEPLPAAAIEVYVDDSLVFDASETGSDAYGQPANYDGAGSNQLRWSSSRIGAGDRLVLEDDADAESGPDEFSDGAHLRIVWDTPDTDRSFVLYETTLRF
jgi:FlaG/FlaF family flagellin (archaellin)